MTEASASAVSGGSGNVPTTRFGAMQSPIGVNASERDSLTVHQERDELAAFLERIVDGAEGRRVQRVLATGQGTDTDDGRAWLEAIAYVERMKTARGAFSESVEAVRPPALIDPIESQVTKELVAEIVGSAKTELLDIQMLAACKAGRMGEVRKLISEGFAVDRLIDLPELSGTPLYVSVLHGRLDLCVMLLDAGADVGARNKAGVTPLLEACRANNLPLCELLFNAGADVTELAPNRETLLHEAVRSGCVELVKWLLEKDVDPNLVGSDGTAPLHLVSATESRAAFAREIAALLVSFGAISCYVPRNASPTYRTPFQHAVAAGDLAAVKFFMEECGETLRQRSFAGATLAQLAQRHRPVAAYLKVLEEAQGMPQERPLVTRAALTKRRSFEWHGS